MAKLRDIAERAGTSIGTVSLVLNNRHRAGRISEATRQAVLDAADALGYSPNLSARRLRANGHGRRSIVLAVAHPIDSRLSLVARIISGMQRQLEVATSELDELRYDVQLTLETFRPGELHRLRGLAEPLWYNGLLVTNTAPEDEAFLESRPLGVPVVLFQRYGALSYVNFDNRAGGEAAARHLAGLGHRRLAVLSPGIHTQLQRLRVEGFLAGAAAAGLDEPVHAVAPGVDWMASGHRAAAPMLDRPAAERPTALFATSDLIALGAVRAARDLGLTVPDDLAVIGYDDAEFAAYAVPSLTTIHSPQEEMAAEAAAILLDLILRRNEGPLQRLLPAQLVVRESCGAHRGGKS